MKKDLFLVCLSPIVLILEVVMFIAYTSSHRPPVSFASELFQTTVLTDTRKEMWDRRDFWGLFIVETQAQPELFGWQGSVLHYKDGNGQLWSYDMSSGQKQVHLSDSVNVNPQNKPSCQNDPPPLSHGLPTNTTLEQLRALCSGVEKNGTVVESWPMVRGGLVEEVRRVLQVRRGVEKVVSDEQRKISKVAISPDGQYIAVKATDPVLEEQVVPDFDPENIYVLELKEDILQ